MNLREYVESCLIPDILEYLQEKKPIINGYSSKYFHFEKLCYHKGSLGPAFNREQQYDLYQMVDILLFPREYSKKQATQSVGAAIRLSKAIGKEEHADKIYEIVKDSFTPEEHPDLTDEHATTFFLFCNSDDEDLD
jgi:hypothetical protein